MIIRTLIKFLAILLISLAAAFMVYITMRSPSGRLFVNSDFEKGTLKNWIAEGAAFESQPTLDDNPMKRGRNLSTKIQGNYWLGTYEKRPNAASPEGEIQGDLLKGTLTSISFIIRKNKIAFLAGAGNGTPETAVSLVVNNNTALTHAPNAMVKANETMALITWDVSPWLKQKATLVIHDQSSGPWGHINVDDFHYA